MPAITECEPFGPGGVTITTLVDNHAAEGLASEHGFALWIETGWRKVLFDTGQLDALEKNAPLLGVDLSSADALVLSHGHYDHTGGLPFFLREAPGTLLYAHPHLRLERYSIREGVPKSIGLPAASLSAIDRLPEPQLRWVEEPMRIAEEITLTGTIPRITSFEDTGGPFFLDPEGKIPDPIDDDLSLTIRTEKGIVLCTGCAHAGLINILKAVQEHYPGEPIRAIIGGFHLVNASKERVQETIAALREVDPELLVPCHCTGDAATEELRGALGDRVVAGAAGSVFRF